MNLKLGEKIKQLRIRDGRRQEDLAAALCVSPQAISRWEANGGYPDMELIPAIANYFHVSIDELFGYNNDREKKIQEIVTKADEMMNSEGHIVGFGLLSDGIEECVNYLRAAAEEFPNQPNILIKLCQALQMLGWHKHGARFDKDSVDGERKYDAEYNAKNIYWQEAVQVYEKLLACDLPQGIGDNSVYQLVHLYGMMGEYEKGKALANKQSPVFICKEIMLTHATNGEEAAGFRGEAIEALLGQLNTLIRTSISSNAAVEKTEYARQLLMSLLNLREMIYEDGRCGREHLPLAKGWLFVANVEAEFGSMQKAVEYFDKAFEHFQAYNEFLKDKDYRYTAPLVSHMKVTRYNGDHPIDKEYWKKEIVSKTLGETLYTELRKNPKYAICFE